MASSFARTLLVCFALVTLPGRARDGVPVDRQVEQPRADLWCEGPVVVVVESPARPIKPRPVQLPPIADGLYAPGGSRPLPFSEWEATDAPARLARSLAGESDLHAPRDWAMIAHVLVRVWQNQRQGWTFGETVSRHTMLERRSARGRWARSLPWGPLVGQVRRAGDRMAWLGLLAFVQAWGQGWIADPCPLAVTWSENPPGPLALANVAKSRLVRLDCGTANVPWGRDASPPGQDAAGTPAPPVAPTGGPR